MTYSGHCSCGRIAASIAAEPLTVRLCWCRQCQQAGGGSATANAVFPRDAITLSGALAEHSYPAASGNRLSHGYCPDCGTQVLAYSSARDDLTVIRLGFLDIGHGLCPSAIIWADEAPDWATFDPSLERSPGPAPQSHWR